MAMLDAVKEYISALSIPSRTKEANGWLIRFEQSRDAWAVNDQLLRESAGSPFRFFSSISLYSKIQRDLKSQLDPAIIPSFTQNLTEHLIRLSREDSPEFALCRYVCLCIAAVAVQLNTPGIVQQILLWLNPIISTSPRIVLELLIVLPEECFNRSICVAGETRDQFASQLSHTVEDVFSFLRFVRSTPMNSEVGSQVLKCLERWIEYIKLDGRSLAAQPIFLYALDCLSSPDLFEQAADVVIITWNKFGFDCPDIVGLLFPRVLSLLSVWREQKALIDAGDIEDLEEERNVCRSISRVVTETAEACLPLVVGDVDHGQMSLLSFLIEVVSFSADFSIARIPLNFFCDLSYLLSTAVTRNPDSFSEYEFNTGRSMLAVSDLTINRLGPVFGALLDAVMSQIVLPESIILGHRKITDVQEDCRLELLDCVSDCKSVLGSAQTLRFICSKLQAEIESSSIRGMRWNVVESVLTASKSVVQSISQEETGLLSHLMSFIGTLPLEMPGLKQTVIEFIGKTSRWLKENPQFISTLMPLLMASLSDPAYCHSAAKSIMSLFKSCSASSIQLLPTSQLFELMVQLRIAGRLPLPSDIFLIEGFCGYISMLDAGSQSGALRLLLTPIATDLSSLLEIRGETSLVNADIDRITCALRFAEISEADVIEQFTFVSPLLQRALELYPVESTSEKVCRCYKHVMRTTKRSFYPLLSGMTCHLSDRFQATQYAAFLYAASICVSSINRDEGAVYLDVVYSMLWKICNTFFSVMNSLESFEKKPDLVEEYFYLMAKTLQYCPGPLLAAPAAETLVQAGITGLELKHKEAQKGILLFFERLVELSIRNKSGVDCSQLILKFGNLLVQKLFLCLSGQMPAYAIDGNNGSISDVLWNLKLLSTEALVAWICGSLSEFPENVQSISRGMDLVLALTTAASRGDFVRILDDFEWRCRKEQSL